MTNEKPAIAVDAAPARLSPNGILLLILLLGLGLRLAGWNIIDTIYKDSVGYVSSAATWKTSDFLRNPYQEPLHLLAIRGVHKLLFPHEVVSDPINHSSWELAAFSVDLFFSLASIGVLFAIGKRLHSPAAGLWAAFFLAVQPFGIIYTINGLTEATYVFFLLTSLYFAMLARPDRKLDFFWLGLWIILGLLTRKDGIILPGIIGIYIFIMKDVKFTAKIKLLLSFSTGLACITGIYLSIGGEFNWLCSSAHFRNWSEFLKKITAGSANPSALLLGTVWQPSRLQVLYLPLSGWIKLSGFFPAFLFIAFLLKPKRFSENRQAWLFILAFLFQLVLVFVFTARIDYFSKRYLYAAAVVIFPPAGVVLTRLLESICEKKQLKNPAIPSRIAFGITFVTLTWALLLSCFHMRHPEIQSAAHWIASNTPPDSLVVVSDNRIGYYCKRKSTYLAAIGSQQYKHGYVTIYYKKNEKQKMHRKLTALATNRKFHLELLKTIATSKKEIQIYQFGQ